METNVQPQPQPQKKSNRLLLILVILILAAVPLCVVGWRLYQRPLGPALDTPIPTATSAPQAVPTGTSEPQAQEAQPDARAISVPIVAANEVCGETAVWNVLVLGSDAADLYYPQGSDLTRIVRVDFPNKQVSMFAFTRDLWVDTLNLGFTNPTINATKLGLVYHEARLRSTKTDPKEIMLEGVNASAKVLAQNFSVNSDHYVAIDVSQIPAMIDAIGGLPINIPANFTDPLTNMAFTAGQQTLNGERAAVYARAFTGSDFERIQRDNLVLEALRQRLQDPAIWVRLPQLFVQFQDVVLTDLSPEQVNNLICLLSEVSSESIIQDGVRAEWTTSGQDGSLLWDRTQVLDRLRELGIIP